MADRILVIDAGTTSTRAMLFAVVGTCLDIEQRAVTQHYPAPGLVEHDAQEVWDRTLDAAQTLLARSPGTVAAIGISNQRETAVAWDRRSGRPLGPAIVWQDRRTADACERLRAQGMEPLVQASTGLLLDPYFSATKYRWLIDHCPQVAAAGDALALGTVESWLVSRLTGGLHISDASNASRTALMALDGGWDAGLCDLFGVPRAALPEIVDCASLFGHTRPDLFGRAIPICGMAGDQQAATIGQACLNVGDVKATYGTGAFILANQGGTIPRSGHRLLGTVLWQLKGQRCYALEGSVFVAGSLIQWLRDGLGVIEDAAESASLAASVPDSGGVVLVPALSGLGAPHWQPQARGSLTGMSFATGRAHIVRAALEAMAHQTRDLAAAFAADRAPWTRLRIDGGMSANNWMAQDIANLLDIEVDRPRHVETTALGAAMLAGVGAGLFGSLDDAAAMRGPVDHFTPAMTADIRNARLAGWNTALDKVLSRAGS